MSKCLFELVGFLGDIAGILGVLEYLERYPGPTVVVLVVVAGWRLWKATEGPTTPEED